MSLFDKTVKLAYEKPELREHLLPLLKEAAPGDKPVYEGNMKEILGLRDSDKLSDFGNYRLAVKKIIDEVGPKQAATMINWAANINPDNRFLERMQDYMKRY